MKNVYFMHIQRGKLHSTSIMGQVLWDVLRFPKGLNPFEVSPSLTFMLSTANPEYKYQMTSMLHCQLDASICRPLCGYLHATSYKAQYTVKLTTSVVLV
jgi:hypothetical protein